MPQPLSVVLGVGASNGIGGAMCRRAAEAGHHVVVVGRTADKLAAVADEITASGGAATPRCADVTDERAVEKLFEEVDGMDGALELVVYNAGNAFRHDTLTMDAGYFESAWRVCCLGGFLAAREAGKRLVAAGRGTILFTGATASVKSRPPYLPFASAKAALRAVAAGMAREFGPKGVHVAHAIIDGGVDGDLLNARAPTRRQEVGENGWLSPDAIAESYWQLHCQHPSAWTFEIDLRPFKEPF